MSIFVPFRCFKQFKAVLVDFMLIFVQFGEILGEVVETFRDLSSQTPVGCRAKRGNRRGFEKTSLGKSLQLLAQNFAEQRGKIGKQGREKK